MMPRQLDTIEFCVIKCSRIPIPLGDFPAAHLGNKLLNLNPGTFYDTELNSLRRGEERRVEMGMCGAGEVLLCAARAGDTDLLGFHCRINKQRGVI